MAKFSFPRKLRLLTSSDFTFVFKQPQKVSMHYITILGRSNMLGYSRIGLTVAKRYVKKAHERNRIKRLARESFRLNQYGLPTMDYVIIAKKNVTNLDNQTLIKVLEKLWCRLYHQFQSY